MAAKVAKGSYLDEIGYEVQFSGKDDLDTSFGRNGLPPAYKECTDARPGPSIANFGTGLEDMSWSNDSSSSGACDTFIHEIGPSFTSPRGFASTLHPCK